MTEVEIEAGLSDLGVGRDNLKILALLPLVQVAWADGVVQAEEREVIRGAADRLGIDDVTLLEGWMSRPPSALQFLAGQQILLALTTRGEGGLMPETLPALVDWCGEVAEAAGGLFGLAFRIEASERAVIAEIANLLQLGPTIDWDRVARSFGD